MADVSPRPPASGGGTHGADRRRGDGPDWGGQSRGQLLLVTALALAVMLVSVALLLNTAIYTENLATRSADPGSPDAVSYQRDAVRGVGRTLSYVNAHHAESNAALRTALDASVREWDDVAARHAAVDADAAGVSLASTVNGTQAVQNRTRNFTAADGSPDWNLTTGVAPDRGIRAFRLSVRHDSLASGQTGAFHVNVTADDQTWHTYVYQNASEVQVAVYNGSTGVTATDANCSVAPTNGTVAVDLTAGTVGGRACGPLSVFSDVNDTFDVAYRDANRVNGTYSVVVNESTLGADAGALDTRSSGNVPYSAPAVYAAEVNVSFDSRRVTYGSRVRVAPGEADD